MSYAIYQGAGWHGEASDPVVAVVDTMEEAAMIAGCRQDIRMPGDCNPYDCYAVDEDGEEVERVDSYWCDGCGELTQWGEYGPTPIVEGKFCEGVEKHLVDWHCEDCCENCCSD